MPPEVSTETPAFLTDGGECGALMRALDWSATPLGPPQAWPQGLKTIVGMILQSQQAMFVAWGEDLTFLYNDAYAAVLGDKHPGLGAPFSRLWADIWPQFEPIVARTLAGESSWFENLPILMERNGQAEQTWFSFSYTPVRGDDGVIAGLFCACFETTGMVSSDRRLRDSEERWRNLFERMQEGVFVGELVRDEAGQAVDFCFLEVNPAFESLTSLAPADTLGRRASDVVPGFNRFLLAPYRDVVESGRPALFELHAPALADRWYEVRARPDGGDRFAVLFIEITERKQADRALRETTRLAETLATERSAILNQLLEGVIVTDASGRITFVNEAAARLHGVERLDVEPDDYTEAYHLFTEDGAPYPPQDLPLSRAVLKGETITEARWRILRPDGSDVLAIGNARPLTGAAGEALGAVLTVRDDTARDGAERALRESEEQARAVVAGAADYAIFVIDPAGAIRSWSEGAAATFGWTEAEAVGRSFSMLFTPEDRSAGADARELAVAAREGCAIDERWHLRKDDSRVFINGSVRPLHSADGSLRGFLKIGRDETQQRLAADRVAASEKQFREMADHAPVILWTTDADGVCTYLNQPWYEVTGQTEAEATGFGWLDATHPDDKAPSGEAFVAANAAQQPFRVEYRLRQADGGYRWAIDAGQPQWSADGVYRGMVGAVFDIADRKAAEAAVTEREQELRLITDALPVLISYVDANQRYRFNNLAYQTWFGADRAALYGRTVREVVGDAAYADVRGAIERTLAGETFSFEQLLPYPSGARQVRATYVPRIEGGRVLGYYAMVQDIGEQKRAEAALAESEARFRAITNSVDQMIWSTLPDGFHDYYNQRWYDYTGVPYGSTDGEAWNGMFHPDDQERAWARWAWSLETGEPYEIEYRLRHRSGEYRWVLGRAQAMRDEQGAIVRWFGTCTDVHEAKATEAALRESEADYRAAAELNPQVAWTATPDGQLDRVAPRWMEWTGRDGLGESWGLSLHPEDLPRTVEAWTRSVTTTVPYDVEHRVLRHDGQVRWARSRAAPRLDAEGAVVRWYGATEDIHEQKSAELSLQLLAANLEAEVEARTRELQVAEESLRQAQKMEAIGQLTGGIAHDFNNLLTGIIGALDLMKRRIDAGRIGEIDRFMDAATTSANRAAALTHRLLAFARRQSLDAKPTDVNQLVAGMEELLHRTLGEQVALKFELEAGLWQATTDANQLESALLNLAINARDAMPDGGQLTVETANTSLDETYTGQHEGLTAGDFVVICVTDTGEGMAPDVIERAFDPFFTTKPIGQGTGLGLSMIYGFARQAGGHARLYSEVGRGTTVKLYLPRHVGEGAHAGAEAPSPELSRGAGETVLVVEDEPAVRLLVVELLTELGYRVIEAHDGPAALPIVDSAERIDLMISDVGLPGLNGRQVAEAARARRPDLKILFITGYAENAAVRGGFLGEGMEMITKPFAIDALADKVQAMLASA